MYYTFFSLFKATYLGAIRIHQFCWKILLYNDIVSNIWVNIKNLHLEMVTTRITHIPGNVLLKSIWLDTQLDTLVYFKLFNNSKHMGF